LDTAAAAAGAEPDAAALFLFSDDAALLDEPRSAELEPWLEPWLEPEPEPEPELLPESDEPDEPD
jgi:hypothetical protein